GQPTAGPTRWPPRPGPGSTWTRCRPARPPRWPPSCGGPGGAGARDRARPPAGEAAELATVLRGPGRVEGERLALAEGNPLLIEQVMGDRDGAAQALVGAELDELPAEERAVLETASVVGQVFDWPSVAALAPEPLAPRVGGLSLALAPRDLIPGAARGPTAPPLP